ncbi:MAG: hypothetical protein ACP5IX_01595 [Patescibacteria group bacterium]
MFNSRVKIILWFWRVILMLIALCFFLWLIWQNLIPSGYLKITKDFCRESKFISNLYPEERVGDIEIDNQNRCWQTIFNEPVYFKIKVSRSFEQVKLKIFYQNEKQPLFQIGLRKKLGWQFQFKPIENQIFDSLDWYKLTQGKITLWQRKKKFETIQQYVNNLPIDRKTAVFYYEFIPEVVKDSTKIVAWNPKIPLQSLDYIITQYQSPKNFGDLKVASVDFFISPEFSDGQQLEFILSAPEMVRNQSQIKIYRLEVELEREPLTLDNFKETINRFIQRLRDI